MLPSSRPLALVTGASSGIGLELAKLFAHDGYDLVIAAEASRIDDVAAELDGSAGVEAVQADLSTDAGVDELWSRVQATGRPLVAAALNAGVGAGGAFPHRAALGGEPRLVALHGRGTGPPAHHAAEHMVDRGEGQ